MLRSFSYFRFRQRLIRFHPFILAHVICACILRFRSYLLPFSASFLSPSLQLAFSSSCVLSAFAFISAVFLIASPPLLLCCFPLKMKRNSEQDLCLNDIMQNLLSIFFVSMSFSPIQFVHSRSCSCLFMSPFLSGSIIFAPVSIALSRSFSRQPTFPSLSVTIVLRADSCASLV